MDATTLRAAIGIALVAFILALALRCDSKSAAQPAPPAPTTVETPMYLTHDFHSATARALTDLQVFLHSVTTTTTTTAAPKRQAPNYAVGDGSRWDQLAECESGGNWAINTGNGFGGGLQFMHQRSYSTWLSFGGAEFAPHPWEASREQQIAVAEKVLASSGWNAWPGCSRKLGLI